MLLQNNLFDPSQFGQGGFGGGPMSMAGPSGFSGDTGGMFGAPAMGLLGQQKQKMNPLMGLGLAGMLAQQHPGYALPAMLGGGLGALLHGLKVF